MPLAFIAAATIGGIPGTFFFIFLLTIGALAALALGRADVSITLLYLNKQPHRQTDMAYWFYSNIPTSEYYQANFSWQH